MIYAVVLIDVRSGMLAFQSLRANFLVLLLGIILGSPVVKTLSSSSLQLLSKAEGCYYNGLCVKISCKWCITNCTTKGLNF